MGASDGRGNKTGGPVVGVEPSGRTGVVVGIDTLSGAMENVPGIVQAPYKSDEKEE